MAANSDQLNQQNQQILQNKLKNIHDNNVAMTTPEIKVEQEALNLGKTSKKPVQIKVNSLKFEVDGENHLSVHMETDRLTLSSANKADKEEYEWLICDRQVVNKYADWATRTVPKLLETSNTLHTMYSDRWNSNYPFSSFAVRLKEPKDEFIGHIVLGNGGKPGTSEIAYLFHHTSKQGKGLWRKGFGTEAVGAVVQEYAPELVNKQYLVGGEKKQALEKIVATSRLDNLGSEGILKALRFSVVGQTQKFGALRNEWEISVPMLVEEHSNKSKGVKSS